MSKFAWDLSDIQVHSNPKGKEDFDESKHPRRKDGEFAPKGGGESRGGRKKKPAVTEGKKSAESGKAVDDKDLMSSDLEKDQGEFKKASSSEPSWWSRMLRPSPHGGAKAGYVLETSVTHLEDPSIPMHLAESLGQVHPFELSVEFSRNQDGSFSWAVEGEEKTDKSRKFGLEGRGSSLPQAIVQAEASSREAVEQNVKARQVSPETKRAEFDRKFYQEKPGHASTNFIMGSSIKTDPVVSVKFRPNAATGGVAWEAEVMVGGKVKASLKGGSASMGNAKNEAFRSCYQKAQDVLAGKTEEVKDDSASALKKLKPGQAVPLGTFKTPEAADAWARKNLPVPGKDDQKTAWRFQGFTMKKGRPRVPEFGTDEGEEHAAFTENQKMRETGKPPSAGFKKVVDMVKRYTIPRPIEVARGMGLKPGEEFPFREGEVFEDKGLASTSLSERNARQYMDDGLGDQDQVLCHITVPKGAKGVYLEYPDPEENTLGELEVLLAPARYMVEKVQKDEDGVTRVRMRVLV
jgi:hypothetical protein